MQVPLGVEVPLEAFLERFNQDVAGFDIAVDHSRLPRCTQSARDLNADLQDLRFGHAALEVDQVIERCDLPAHVVLQELTILSLRGALKRVDGNTYAKHK